ncbi:MAG: hypothetical protein ACREJO_00560 [Phycisphaerales bacterium]
MGKQARVTNVDALRDLRGALIVFAQECANALADVDSDAQRTMHWLRSEAPLYWQRQVRERAELLTRAKSELYRRQMTAIGDLPPGATDQKINLDVAKRRFEEAEEKLRSVKRWAMAIEREFILYKATVQPLADASGRDVPLAVARLDRMASSLEDYQQIAPPTVESTGISPEVGTDGTPPAEPTA